MSRAYLMKLHFLEKVRQVHFTKSGFFGFVDSDETQQ